MRCDFFLPVFFGFMLDSVLVYAWPLGNLVMAGPRASLAIGDSVAMGIQKAMVECKYQFQWERWNCDQDPFPIIKSQITTREMAYVQAIVSSGITYFVAKNCSNGDFSTCGCDTSKQGKLGPDGYKWSGCSDSTDFGEKTSSDFLDSQETGRDDEALVKLHNIEVGRTAVKKTMKKVCKCHGVSGSCATRTCTMRLAEFREIGNFLKTIYKKAEKLKENNRAKEQKDKSNNQTKLFYTEESPNYCLNKSKKDQSMNNEGDFNVSATYGRTCSRRKGEDVTKEEKRSCKHLCKQCGLSVSKRTQYVSSSCNCKFVWCCEVKCDVCRRKVKQYLCT